MFLHANDTQSEIDRTLRLSYSVRSDSPTPPENTNGIVAYSPVRDAFVWGERKHWTTETVVVQKDDKTTTHFIHTYRHEEYTMTDAALASELDATDMTAPSDAINDGPLTFSPDQPASGPVLTAEQEAEAVESPRGADAIVDLDAETVDPLAGYALLAEIPANLGHGQTIIYDRVIKTALDNIAPEDIGTLKIIRIDDVLKLVMADGYEPATDEIDDEDEGDSGLGLEAILSGLFGGAGSAGAPPKPQTFDEVMRAVFAEALGNGGDQPLAEGVFKPGENLEAVREAVAKALAEDPDHLFGFHVHRAPLALFELLADVWSGDDHASEAAIANGCVARMKGEDRERMCQTFEDLDSVAFLDAMTALEHFAPPLSKGEVKSNAYSGVMSMGFNLLLSNLSPESQDVESLLRSLKVPVPVETFADIMAHFVNEGVIKEQDGEFRLSPRGQVLKGFQGLLSGNSAEAFTLAEIARWSGLTEMQTAKALPKLEASDFVSKVEAGDEQRWRTNV